MTIPATSPVTAIARMACDKEIGDGRNVEVAVGSPPAATIFRSTHRRKLAAIL